MLAILAVTLIGTANATEIVVKNNTDNKIKVAITTTDGWCGDSVKFVELGAIHNDWVWSVWYLHNIGRIRIYSKNKVLHIDGE